jgi:hypothetical protein
MFCFFFFGIVVLQANPAVKSAVKTVSFALLLHDFEGNKLNTVELYLFDALKVNRGCNAFGVHNKNL